MREAKAALERAGHELVPFDVFTGKRRGDDDDPVLCSALEFSEIFVGLMTADGQLQGLRDGLEGEALVPSYRQVAMMADMPNILRGAVSALLTLLGQTRPAIIIQPRVSGGKTANE